MELLIRTAEMEDAETIAELSNKLGYGAKIKDIKNRLFKILQNQENCVYVATEREKIVGWIHGFVSQRIESDFFIEIGGLVVDEKKRKMGIGEKLVSEVIKWAELKNYQKIRVRCNVIRTGSHEFYKNIGFKINKEQKVFDKLLK